MNNIKKILAPTDISDLSVAGLRRALEMAKASGAEVIVQHVVRQPILFHSDFPPADIPLIADIVAERKSLLEDYMEWNFADLTPGLKVSIIVETGIPYAAILDKARKENVDLIVMSTHGRTGLMHVLIGSVTERVVRQALCPVLSIRPAEAMKAAKAAA
jgi:nucleotide-binding universal stress UspA family protein